MTSPNASATLPLLPSILDVSETALAAWFTERGGKAYWAKQVLRWVFEKRVLNPERYTDLPPTLRNALAESYSFELPELDSCLASSDGSEKILLKSTDGKFFECVLMPSDDRITICVSCQVGCRMACTFCQTGRLGLSRNLTKGEILAQVLCCYKQLEKRGIDRRITNVVFMGMGEPLDNFDNVVEASKVMLAPHYFGMSKHRVTISTCGLVPEIRRLAKEFPLRLAISLHSADPTRRTQLMPINRQHTLEELKQALLDYPAGRDGITFEYIMLDGINDSIEYAKKLVKFLHGLKAKVNLIPMNAHPGMEWKPSSEKNMREFQRYLSERSIPAPIRYSRADDVSGACGQLAAKRKEEVHLPPKRRQRR
jgi:23S rRNA (adenine2503-C2)-methyltransferase